MEVSAGCSWGKKAEEVLEETALSCQAWREAGGCRKRWGWGGVEARLWMCVETCYVWGTELDSASLNFAELGAGKNCSRLRSWLGALVWGPHLVPWAGAEQTCLLPFFFSQDRPQQGSSEVLKRVDVLCVSSYVHTVLCPALGAWNKLVM